MVTRYEVADMPDQQGRVAVVTGATGGLGFETARALVERGCTVVVTGRDEARLAQTPDRIEGPGTVVTMPLDLADLDSVHRAAQDLAHRHPRIDLLVNNAGVMAPPQRGVTADGFEQQFGTNHLGHFALTAGLIGCIRETPQARVVTVSSAAHWLGTIDFADLQASTSYRPMGTYAQSKLANLLFTLELQRRLEDAGAQAIAVSAHPGIAATDLQRHSRLWRRVAGAVGQSAAGGSLATLYAATSPTVAGGDFIGPGGLPGRVRPVGRARMSPRSRDASLATRLWRASEELTGISFEIPPA